MYHWVRQKAKKKENFEFKPALLHKKKIDIVSRPAPGENVEQICFKIHVKELNYRLFRVFRYPLTYDVSIDFFKKAFSWPTKECSRGVIVKSLEIGIVERKFKLQSCYYVHFRTNTVGKGRNLLILPAMG